MIPAGGPARASRPGGLRRELKLPRLPPATLAALAALVVLAALPLLPALTGARTLFIRDIGMVWLPQADAFVRTVAEGAWPLWDRWAGFGRPLLADPRAGVLYPPTWLNLVLPPARFYPLFALGHLVFSAWGAFALARQLGFSRCGALVTGAVWVASGPLPSLVAMWHHLAGAAWIPWILLAGERALDAPGPRRTSLWAVLLAAQVFAGSPDYCLITGGLVLAQLAVRTLRSRQSGAGPVRIWGPALLAAALAAGLAAAQWLPTLDVVSRAARLDQGDQARTVWSLTLARLLEVVLPFSWADLPLSAAALERVVDGRAPWLFSVYLGGAGLGLAAAGVAAGERRARALALLWLIPALLLALGRHSWFYDLVSGIPPLSLLRYPVKAMLGVALGWSVLAGLGFDAIARGERRGRIGAGLALAAVALLALGSAAALGAGAFDAALAFRPEIAPGAVAQPLGWRLAIAGAIASACALACRFGPRHRRVAIALGLLSAIEPVWHHKQLHPTAPASLFGVRPEVLDLLGPMPPGRLYAYDYSQAVSPEAARRGNAGAYRLARAPAGFGIPEAVVLGAHAALTPPSAERWGIEGSYDLDILGFEPRRLDALTRRLRALESDPEAHRRLLALGAVSRVVALVPAPWWEALEPLGERPGWFTRPVRAFAVPDARPQAWVVSGVRVARGEAALDLVTATGFDPARELLLPAGEPRPAGPPPGRVELVQRRGDRVEFQVEMDRAGFLVMADAWDPGWRVRVDGEPAPLLRANVAFRGVALPGGRHRVVLVYRPTAAGLGLLVSGLSALAMAGVAWRVSRRG